MALKISFCTNCMNRSEHLKHMFMTNVMRSLPYDDIEFVLLNYNSKDDMHEWVHEKILPEFSDRVKYYRTTEPEYYDFSHAKNASHLLATGNVLCQLDADAEMPQKFIPFLFDAFGKNRSIVVSRKIGPGGQIAISKKNFIRLGGYDESLIYGWGWDDKDFVKRARLYGLKRVVIPEKLRYIRIDHEHLNENFKHKLHYTQSAELNRKISEEGRIKVNQYRSWGQVKLDNGP